MEKTEIVETFEKTVLKIALPVTLQSLLQSSFSVIDQVMIGQLGSESIAGIGLGGKFVSIYSVVLAAIAAVAGIMISQYMGRKDHAAAGKSFYSNMAFSLVLAAVFMGICIVFPESIMALYTKDGRTKGLAVQYLRIFAFSFLPMAVSSIVTTMLRCMEAALFPLYTSIFALLLNTGFNYFLIFGKWIFPEMGVEGAALASVIAQLISCAMILFFFRKRLKKQNMKLGRSFVKKIAGKPDGKTGEAEITGKQKMIRKQTFHDREYIKQYLEILCPMLICEFLWSLGENVYTAIYGNIGTDACAAMTMTIPVQTMLIGALSGLSQASSILIGKSLGAEKYEQAYAESEKLIRYGLIAAIFLAVLLIAVSPFYVRIYRVDSRVQEMTRWLLSAFAVIAPVKVLNMIIGGGILRSGGKTKYVMWIDITGTWCFGVPLGLLAAFVWKLPIVFVYMILSLEECVRLGISLVVFGKKKWMESIQ